MKDLCTALHLKLTLQGHTVPTDGHDGIANVLFISIGAHVHLFKVHRHTRVPRAKLGEGGWLWASLTIPLRSLSGPLAAEASLLPSTAHPDLALAERRLGPPTTTDWDLLELHNTVGLESPSPCQPG